MKENGFIRDYWSKSQLSFVKLIVTAIAAITVSAISSKLGGSGILIAGLIAATSLVLNEGYNLIFQWISYKAKTTIKIATPLNAKLEEVNSSQIEKVSTSISENTDPDDNTKANEDTNQVDPQGTADPQGTHEDVDNRGVFRTIGDFLNTHSNFRLILFFVLVTSTFFAISYYSPRVQNVMNPVITKEVTESQKQEIINEAIDAAAQSISQEEKVVMVENDLSPSFDQRLSEVESDTETLLSQAQSNDDSLGLDTKLRKLEEENQELKTTIELQKEKLTTLETQITTLNARLDDILGKIEAIQRDGEQ